MSDTPLFGPGDQVDDIEALLSELDDTDFEITAPPPDVWSGIDAAVRSDEGAAVVPLTSRRSRFNTTFLGAVAAVALLAVGAVVVTSIAGGSDPVIAAAELAYDPEAFDPLGADAAATAELVESGDGYEIRLDDASLPDPAADDLELWLIAVRPDGSLDVQPVALVDPSSPGTYAVPADLDPEVYSVVDISVEPRDGDETHSGRSILRGVLAEV